MSKRAASFSLLASLLALLIICAIGYGAVSNPVFVSRLFLAAYSTSSQRFDPGTGTEAIVALNSASSGNYAFATNTLGSFTDMGQGAALLVGPDTDDTASAVTPIGFEFYLMGNRYTQFSVNSNGLIGLGGTAIAPAGYSVASGNAVTPVISAFGGDLRTGSAGRVRYKVTGAAPNRILMVDFANMSLLSVASPGLNDGSFQVRLYETSGKIEFVYGPMSRNAGTSAQNGQGVGIGFAIGQATNEFVNIISADNTSNFAAPFVEQTYATGPIANLNSPTDGSRRVYSITPTSSAAAPTNLTFTGVTASAMTLNWTDSANELGYAIYRSTDGGTTYAYHGSAASDVTTLAVTALQPGETYDWRVYSLSEGGPSGSPLTGRQATVAAGTTYYWVGASGDDWSTAASWNTVSDGTGTGRTTPNGSDVLIVDGAGTTAGAAVTIVVSGSESIGALRVTSGTACVLRSSATVTRTLTITGNTGEDLEVQSGSSLLFSHAANPVAIAFSTSTGMSGNIAGTLSFVAGGSPANSVTTTGGIGTTVKVASTGVVNIGIADDNVFVGSSDTLLISDG